MSIMPSLPATWLFVVSLNWTKSKSHLCITGLLWGESPGDRWIPLANGKWCGKRSMSWHHYASRHWGWDRMDAIFQTTISNAFSWMKISLKFVPKVPINNIAALIQIMALHRPGDKPLSEPMMVNLLTHICVTRPQWVKTRLCCCMEKS